MSGAAPGSESGGTSPASGSAAIERVALSVLALLLGFGCVRAIQLAWMCDDAFISLRYAAQLVEGHGLVYNPGEYVEGYSNLLWTLVLAAALAAGAPDVASAEALGIAAYLALAALLAAASWRRSQRGAPFLPIAAGVVLVSRDFHEWATGGLETSLFAALAFAGVALATRPGRSDRSDLVAGWILAALVLTRLDGVLVAGSAWLGGLWLAPATERVRRAAFLATPVVLTMALLFAWKLAYYGELWPTAFHSKSVLDPYVSQGLRYLGLYLQRNWILPVVVALVLGLRLTGGRGLTPGEQRGLAFAGSAALYLAYVVTVGGDFMFARRIVVVAPLLWWGIEAFVVEMTPTLARPIAVATLLGALIPYPVFGEGARTWGIGDQRRFYPEAAFKARRAQAAFVGRALAGTAAKVMFEGGMCAFGYYSRLPYLVEASGLTQYSLAKLPLERRGWIGHEKQATEAWTTENGIHLVVEHEFPPIKRPANPPLDRLWFGNVAVARIHHYDDTLMDHLRSIDGVAFTPIETVIERERRAIERVGRERAEARYAWLKRYYLDGAGNRGERIAKELRARIDAK